MWARKTYGRLSERSVRVLATINSYPEATVESPSLVMAAGSQTQVFHSLLTLGGRGFVWWREEGRRLGITPAGQLALRTALQQKKGRRRA